MESGKLVNGLQGCETVMLSWFETYFLWLRLKGKFCRLGRDLF